MSFNYVNNRILTSNEPFLVLSPSTVEIVGRSAAIVLQQLHYWISSPGQYGNVEDNKRWIYNSYEEWQNQIKVFSTKTIQRAFKKLCDLGVVLTKKMNKKASDQTKSYTINYEKLNELTGVGESHVSEGEDKLSSPSGQNDQIFIKNTKKTTEKTSFTKREEKNQNKKEDFMLTKTKISSTSIPEEMLSIWNTVVDENKTQLSLDPLRTRFFKKAFTDAFQNNMDQWREYCYKIASSKFLMGEVNDFKASLDWSLKFEIIHRIKEGAYNQGTRITGKDLIKNSNESIEVDLNNITDHESREAISIRKKIIKKVGNSMYQSWFSKSRIIMKEGRGTIFVANKFRNDRIQTQFCDVLESLCLEVDFSNDYASMREEDTQNENKANCAQIQKCNLSGIDVDTHHHENFTNKHVRQDKGCVA